MGFLRHTPAFSPVLQEGGGNPRWTPCVCECCRPWPAGPSPRPRRSQSRGAAPPGVPARGPPCWPAPPLPHTPDQAWAEAAGVTRCVQAPRALERGEQARAALSEAAASAHRFAGCGCGHAPGHLSHCPRPGTKATALSKASLGWALCPVFPRWGHGIQCRWGPAYHGLVRMLRWAPGCPSAQTSLEGRVGWGWGPLDLPQLLAFWETCSHFRFRDGDSEAWRRELCPRHELVGEQLRSRRGPRLEPTVPHSSHALSRGSPTVP